LLDERGGPGGWVPDDDDLGVERPEAREPEPVDERIAIEGGRHRAPGHAVRWDPGQPGARSLWLAAVAAAGALVVWSWLDRPVVEPAPDVPAGNESSSPPEEPATPTVGEVAERSATVVVSVVGLVARPGLVTLPSGARVAAAIDGAGGLLPGADPASVNLAAVVTDGQQITVGVPGAPAAGGAPGGPAPGGAAGAGGLVDLNTASVGELDALPGIGPVLAQRIVDHRTREGPFRSVDQLDDVPGIGAATAAELAGLVTV
jgi:competence protein ComEA